MRMIPYDQATLVSPLSAHEVRQRLEKMVRPPESDGRQAILAEFTYLGRNDQTEYPFRGWVKEEQFLLFKNSPFPEHFAPLIKGRIEATSMGSIIFIRYQLLGGTLFFSVLGGLVLGCIATVFLLFQQNLWIFLLVLALMIGAYIVLLLNFREKLKNSKQALHKVLV